MRYLPLIRETEPTQYVLDRGNIVRYRDGSIGWWLRSFRSNNGMPSGSVSLMSMKNEIISYSSYSDPQGVRPCIWVDLSALDS